MPRLEKAAVTKHDFVKMGEKVERLRSDTHAGMTDLHEAMRANADHVAQHIEKLNTSLSEHAGLVRDLIQLLEHLH